MNRQTQDRNNTPFLEVRSVSFSYDDKLTGRALKDVSFFVRKGERIAILGHNGSGKSTLVKILGGLVEPDEGSCLVEGVDMQNMEFRDLRGKLGMVFQDPENQIVAAMVEDDVAFAPENQGLPSDEIQQRVDSALARVNMTHKQDSSVEALSGGEKQRVALAGALAAKVECLILDEATAMLDPKGRMDIEKTLREIHGEGMTIIQVTHQIEAENFDDIERVIVLSKGGVIWNGETSEFWSKAEELGFNVPDEFKIKKFFADSKVDFATADFSHVKSMFSSEPRHEDAGHEVKFSVEGLSFRYDEKNFALRNLDVKIYAGQWLSIIGRTGSGKSTFVQHLNALYKIQSGDIFFDGQSLPQKGNELYGLRQRVGLVFQHPEDQLFSATVKEELSFAPKNAGFKGADLDNAVSYGLECVGLNESFFERNPLALSGGERRLVAIASVLATRPECVVLDEPLAGLDASYQKKILTMLGSLRDSGKTIITITHDINVALNCSDRILILRNGGKITECPPSEAIEEIMNILEPEAWPDVLRASAEIRKLNKDFPLLYNYQDFIKCFSQT